ncbi:MAG: hypothetical protein DI586_05590 [Micavibrio aeruginosavorus]|uniref:Uncharacterized protein n=1 Tax=Micavibrio aeruginosavorus TaxID=349221 RepID=A0A2W5HCI4_9BACT|nr:MAG: hypothetical protein DI586_05590 [Micavibrio aeruginosavorus]
MEKTMASYEHNSSDLIQPISIADLWNTLMRRKAIIIASVLLFILLGAIAYVVMPRLYLAKAVILLENRQRNIQIQAVVTTEPKDDMLIPSEIQVLMSRALMGKVVDQLKLVDNPSLLTEKPEKASEDNANNSGDNANANATPPPQLSRQERQAKRDAIVSRILGRTNVKQIEKSRAIEVSYQGLNPEICARIVNTLVHLYIEQQLTSNFEAIRMTNDWLSERVRETQKKVLEADTKVAKYRAKAGIVDSRGIDLIEQNITELSNKLATAKARAADTDARLSAIKNAGSQDTLPEVLNAPLIQTLRGREIQARDQLAALQNQLGTGHPKVTAARAQVDEINGKINQEISKVVEGIRRENQASTANVKNIEEQIEKLKGDYTKYKADNVELAALESEALTSRAFLETLNLRFKETQSQEDNKFQAPYARIISEALVPDRPFSPRAKMLLVMSILVGLGLGTGLALGLDMIQHGIYNGKYLQMITGKTNIASVPKASLAPDKGLISYADFPVVAPLSPFMQGIRALSAFIRHEVQERPDVKLYNFTSSVAGEGKSALVVSTARQLALEGLKVLAIDCDVHQPTLSNTFGVMQKPGLYELLKGLAPLEEVLFRDGVTGAMVIGAGRLDDVNVMSLGKGEWQRILNSVATGFDVVLLDSPPVTSYPEARTIARLSQNILCVRWKRTSVKAVGFTLDTLDRLGCTIIGTVINRSRSSHHFVRDSYKS